MTEPTSNRRPDDPLTRLRAADPARSADVDAAADPTSPRARSAMEAILMSTDPTSTGTTTPGTTTPGKPSPGTTTSGTTTSGTTTSGAARRNPMWIAAAAAAVLLAGIVGAFALGGSDDSDAELDTATAGLPLDDGTGAGSDDGLAGTSGPVDEPGLPSAPPGDSGSQLSSCVEMYSLETLQNREYAFDGTVTTVEGDAMSFDVNEWFTDDEGPGITLDPQDFAGMLFAPEGPALETGTRVLLAGDGGFVWSCGFVQAYDPALADQWRTALGG